MRINNKEARKFGKLLWYDPNPTDNEPIDLSELTISVDLQVTNKSRSIISVNSQNGTIVTDNNGESTVINVDFFDGSRFGNSEGDARALTTNYTNIQHLGGDLDNDYEALGIDSINIEFNSSYAPMVKIKFIDVRGAAMFSNGGNGKYKFFFEMPYPLFNLKIKGYYGKTVRYCLHLLRFNANFNSQTGNFEIDCDFIGFTYALLTDMLMGLVRASVTTKRGQAIFKKFKSEYKNQDNIITIDELVIRISEINETVTKIKEGEETKRLSVTQKSKEEVENLRSLVIRYLDYYSQGANAFTANNASGILIITEPDANEKKRLDTEEGVYKENVKKKIITDIKPLIGFDSPEPNIKKIKDELDPNNDETCIYFTSYGYIKYHGLDTSIISDETTLSTRLTNNGFVGGSRLETIISLLQSIDFKGVSKISIIDLSRAIKACDNTQSILDNENTNAVTTATDKLKSDIRGVLGFDPTIRNLFRILCVSTEVFLQCMVDVSREAENDIAGKRENALAKLRNGLDTIGKTGKVFPWPEYKKKGVESDGYFEEWLGNDIPTTNVPELKFTEELLNEMLYQAKADKQRDFDLNNEDNWWPISVIDTPIDNGLNAKITINPYKIGLNNELSGVKPPTNTPDEALRVMMYRAFLLLGVVNRNLITDDFIKIHAKLEAENLYNVLKQMPDTIEATTITNSIANTNGLAIYNKFKTGKPLVFNGAVKPFFIEKTIGGTEYCKYNYIVNYDSERAYIPINGNFDGTAFRVPNENGKLKIPESILKIRDKGGLFVSNHANHTRINNKLSGYNTNIDNSDGVNNYDNRSNYLIMDGAISVKIISEETYNSSSLNPNFGLSVLSKITGSNPIFHDRIDKAISDKNNVEFYNSPLTSGPYLANTYNSINYKGGSNYSVYVCDNFTGEQADDAGGVASSFLAFFNQVTKYQDIVATYPNFSYNGFSKDYKEEKRYYGWHSYNTKNSKSSLHNGLNKQGLFKVHNTIVKRSWDNEILLGEDYYTDYGKNRAILNAGLNGAEIYVPKIEYCVDGLYSYSLFGSEFYYSQGSSDLALSGSTDETILKVTVGNASKALLFLHCFPFQGVNRKGERTTDISDVWDRFMFDFNGTDDKGVDINESSTTNATSRASEVLGIKALFRLHNSFIEAPKIWTLFIGAMLWRQQYGIDTNYECIRYHKHGKSNEFIIPNMSIFARTDEFLSVVIADNIGSSQTNYVPAGMHFNSAQYSGIKPYSNDASFGSYSRIDETLIGLPVQIKDEFINKFLYWVSDGFNEIQEALEIKFNAGTIYTVNYLDDYVTKWNNLNNLYTTYPDSTDLALNKSDVATNLGQNIVDNYIMVGPISDKVAKMRYVTSSGVNSLNQDDYNKYVNNTHSFNMELDPNSEGMTLITNLLKEKVYIQNVNPEAWNPPNLNVKPHKLVNGYTPIEISKRQLNLFIDTFQLHFNTISEKFDEESDNEENKIQQELFNSMDDDKIKLNIYRTLMSIYQKWIGGLKGNMFTQCSVNASDKLIAELERGDKDNTKLIDSFRFLDRSFNDIGDAFYMNPQIFYNMITKNRNASFFDIANKVLSDNNFNFIPLPTFINFNNPKELSDMFEPYPWNDQVASGPSFVCVYAGQSSTNLDLGINSNYPDDGIFITVNESGEQSGLPPDLINKGTLTPYETNLPVFTVNYGQQNQNYFKDIKLDQSEFSETAESLQIIDDISQGGDKRKNVMVGQNLFNTYQKRSYSCQVEMLGCALIQPMMYFQLNNIPMFRGLYLIINVSHSIKPNGMTTTFKGVRVKKTKTPLLTASDVLMTLIGDVSNVNSGKSTVGRSSSCPSIVINTETASKVEDVRKRLEDNNTMGLSSNVISGIMGNLKAESGFITGNYNNKGGGCGAYGLAQWRSDRQKNLSKLAISLNTNSDNLDTQIKFIYSELASRKTLLAALKTSNISIDVATRLWYLNFELTSNGISGTIKVSDYETEDKVNALIDRTKIFKKANKTHISERVVYANKL
jgi:hypothetical protein